MELTIEDYLELERLGLEYKETQETKNCKDIRDLEYSLYFNNLC